MANKKTKTKDPWDDVEPTLGVTNNEDKDPWDAVEPTLNANAEQPQQPKDVPLYAKIIGKVAPAAIPLGIAEYALTGGKKAEILKEAKNNVIAGAKGFYDQSVGVVRAGVEADTALGKYSPNAVIRRFSDPAIEALPEGTAKDLLKSLPGLTKGGNQAWREGAKEFEEKALEETTGYKPGSKPLIEAAGGILQGIAMPSPAGKAKAVTTAGKTLKALATGVEAGVLSNTGTSWDVKGSDYLKEKAKDAVIGGLFSVGAPLALKGGAKVLGKTAEIATGLTKPVVKKLEGIRERSGKVLGDLTEASQKTEVNDIINENVSKALSEKNVNAVQALKSSRELGLASAAKLTDEQKAAENIVIGILEDSPVYKAVYEDRLRRGLEPFGEGFVGDLEKKIGGKITSLHDGTSSQLTASSTLDDFVDAALKDRNDIWDSSVKANIDTGNKNIAQLEVKQQESLAKFKTLKQEAKALKNAPIDEAGLIPEDLKTRKAKTLEDLKDVNNDIKIRETVVDEAKATGKMEPEDLKKRMKDLESSESQRDTLESRLARLDKNIDKSIKANKRTIINQRNAEAAKKNAEAAVIRREYKTLGSLKSQETTGVRKLADLQEKLNAKPFTEQKPLQTPEIQTIVKRTPNDSIPEPTIVQLTEGERTPIAQVAIKWAEKNTGVSRGAYKQQQESQIQTVKDLVEAYQGKSSNSSGERFKAGIENTIEDLNTKLQSKYDNIEVTGKTHLPLDPKIKDSLKRSLNDELKSVEGNSGLAKHIKAVISDLDNIKTVRGLDEFRKSIGSHVKSSKIAGTPYMDKVVVGKLYKDLDDAYASIISKSDVDVQKLTGHKDIGEYFKSVKAEYKKDVIEGVQSKQSKTIANIAEGFEEETLTKRINKWKSSPGTLAADVKLLNADAKVAVKQDIFENILAKHSTENGRFNLNAAAKELDSLDTLFANKDLFSDAERESIKTLKQVWRDLGYSFTAAHIPENGYQILALGVGASLIKNFMLTAITGFSAYAYTKILNSKKGKDVIISLIKRLDDTNAYPTNPKTVAALNKLVQIALNGDKEAGIQSYADAESRTRNNAKYLTEKLSKKAR